MEYHKKRDNNDSHIIENMTEASSNSSEDDMFSQKTYETTTTQKDDIDQNHNEKTQNKTLSPKRSYKKYLIFTIGIILIGGLCVIFKPNSTTIKEDSNYHNLGHEYLHFDSIKNKNINNESVNKYLIEQKSDPQTYNSERLYIISLVEHLSQDCILPIITDSIINFMLGNDKSLFFNFEQEFQECKCTPQIKEQIDQIIEINKNKNKNKSNNNIIKIKTKAPIDKSCQEKINEYIAKNKEYKMLDSQAAIDYVNELTGKLEEGVEELELNIDAIARTLIIKKHNDHMEQEEVKYITLNEQLKAQIIDTNTNRLRENLDQKIYEENPLVKNMINIMKQRKQDLMDALDQSHLLTAEDRMKLSLAGKKEKIKEYNTQYNDYSTIHFSYLMFKMYIKVNQMLLQISKSIKECFGWTDLFNLNNIGSKIAQAIVKVEDEYRKNKKSLVILEFVVNYLKKNLLLFDVNNLDNQLKQNYSSIIEKRKNTFLELYQLSSKDSGKNNIISNIVKLLAISFIKDKETDTCNQLLNNILLYKYNENDKGIEKMVKDFFNFIQCSNSGCFNKSKTIQLTHNIDEIISYNHRGNLKKNQHDGNIIEFEDPQEFIQYDDSKIFVQHNAHRENISVNNIFYQPDELARKEGFDLIYQIYEYFNNQCVVNKCYDKLGYYENQKQSEQSQIKCIPDPEKPMIIEPFKFLQNSCSQSTGGGVIDFFRNIRKNVTNFFVNDAISKLLTEQITKQINDNINTDNDSMINQIIDTFYKDIFHMGCEYQLYKKRKIHEFYILGNIFKKPIDLDSSSISDTMAKLLCILSSKQAVSKITSVFNIMGEYMENNTEDCNNKQVIQILQRFTSNEKLLDNINYSAIENIFKSIIHNMRIELT